MRYLVLLIVVCLACSSDPITATPSAGGSTAASGEGGQPEGGAGAAGDGGGAVGGDPGGGDPGGSGGAGGLPECMTPDECAGVDDECSWRVCVAGVCGTAFAAADTPLASQVVGDCNTDVCDGAGGVVSSYTPADLVPMVGDCVVASSCTMAGPVHDLEPIGTACNDTCGCPQHNNGVCGPTVITCTQGLCNASGVCVDAIPVQCDTGNTTYTRCDLTAGAFSISWELGMPDEGSCSMLADDVDYCPPGTVCYVNDVNGWLGPVLGTGVCL